MILYKFGTYEFPKYGVLDDLGAAEAPARLLPTQGGAFDTLGPDIQADDAAAIISRSCMLIEDSVSDMQDALDDARALRGTYAKLYALTRTGSGRWKYARCRAVQELRTGKNVLNQPIRFAFDVSDGVWRNSQTDSWTLNNTPTIYLNTGYFLNSGAYTSSVLNGGSHVDITVNNGGNRAIYDPVITITAKTSAITTLLIENNTNGLSDWRWADSLAADESLVIDCGQMSVLNNGVDDYDEVTIGSTHFMSRWLQIDPGDNVIRIGATGGTSSVVSITFNGGWS